MMIPEQKYISPGVSFMLSLKLDVNATIKAIKESPHIIPRSSYSTKIDKDFQASENLKTYWENLKEHPKQIDYFLNFDQKCILFSSVNLEGEDQVKILLRHLEFERFWLSERFSISNNFTVLIEKFCDKRFILSFLKAVHPYIEKVLKEFSENTKLLIVNAFFEATEKMPFNEVIYLPILKYENFKTLLETEQKNNKARKLNPYFYIVTNASSEKPERIYQSAIEYISNGSINDENYTRNLVVWLTEQKEFLDAFSKLTSDIKNNFFNNAFVKKWLNEILKNQEKKFQLNTLLQILPRNIMLDLVHKDQSIYNFIINTGFYVKLFPSVEIAKGEKEVLEEYKRFHILFNKQENFNVVRAHFFHSMTQVNSEHVKILQMMTAEQIEEAQKKPPKFYLKTSKDGREEIVKIEDFELLKYKNEATTDDLALLYLLKCYYEPTYAKKKFSQDEKKIKNKIVSIVLDTINKYGSMYENKLFVERRIVEFAFLNEKIYQKLSAEAILNVIKNPWLDSKVKKKYLPENYISIKVDEVFVFSVSKTNQKIDYYNYLLVNDKEFRDNLLKKITLENFHNFTKYKSIFPFLIPHIITQAKKNLNESIKNGYLVTFAFYIANHRLLHLTTEDDVNAIISQFFQNINSETFIVDPFPDQLFNELKDYLLEKLKTKQNITNELNALLAINWVNECFLKPLAMNDINVCPIIADILKKDDNLLVNIINNSKQFFKLIILNCSLDYFLSFSGNKSFISLIFSETNNEILTKFAYLLLYSKSFLDDIVKIFQLLDEKNRNDFIEVILFNAATISNEAICSTLLENKSLKETIYNNILHGKSGLKLFLDQFTVCNTIINLNEKLQLAEGQPIILQKYITNFHFLLNSNFSQYEKWIEELLSLYIKIKNNERLEKLTVFLKETIENEIKNLKLDTIVQILKSLELVFFHDIILSNEQQFNVLLTADQFYRWFFSLEKDSQLFKMHINKLYLHDKFIGYIEKIHNINNCSDIKEKITEYFKNNLENFEKLLGSKNFDFNNQNIINIFMSVFDEYLKQQKINKSVLAKICQSNSLDLIKLSKNHWLCDFEYYVGEKNEHMTNLIKNHIESNCLTFKDFQSYIANNNRHRVFIMKFLNSDKGIEFLQEKYLLGGPFKKDMDEFLNDISNPVEQLFHYIKLNPDISVYIKACAPLFFKDKQLELYNYVVSKIYPSWVENTNKNLKVETEKEQTQEKLNSDPEIQDKLRVIDSKLNHFYMLCIRGLNEKSLKKESFNEIMKRDSLRNDLGLTNENSYVISFMSMLMVFDTLNDKERNECLIRLHKCINALVEIKVETTNVLILFNYFSILYNFISNITYYFYDRELIENPEEKNSLEAAHKATVLDQLECYLFLISNELINLISSFNTNLDGCFLRDYFSNDFLIKEKLLYKISYQLNFNPYKNSEMDIESLLNEFIDKRQKFFSKQDLYQKLLFLLSNLNDYREDIKKGIAKLLEEASVENKESEAYYYINLLHLILSGEAEKVSELLKNKFISNPELYILNPDALIRLKPNLKSHLTISHLLATKNNALICAFLRKNEFSFLWNSHDSYEQLKKYATQNENMDCTLCLDLYDHFRSNSPSSSKNKIENSFFNKKEQSEQNNYGKKEKIEAAPNILSQFISDVKKSQETQKSLKDKLRALPLPFFKDDKSKSQSKLEECEAQTNLHDKVSVLYEVYQVLPKEHHSEMINFVNILLQIESNSNSQEHEDLYTGKSKFLLAAMKNQFSLCQNEMPVALKKVYLSLDINKASISQIRFVLNLFGLYHLLSSNDWASNKKVAHHDIHKKIHGIIESLVAIYDQLSHRNESKLEIKAQP